MASLIGAALAVTLSWGSDGGGNHFVVFCKTDTEKFSQVARFSLTPGVKQQLITVPYAQPTRVWCKVKSCLDETDMFCSSYSKISNKLRMPDDIEKPAGVCVSK